MHTPLRNRSASGLGPTAVLNYQRSVRLADAVIVNSNSLRAEIDKYLEVDPKKVSLIYEAVDHDIFKPGNGDAARAHVASSWISRPFVLFVSSLWRYKNCDGLLQGLEARSPRDRGSSARDPRSRARPTIRGRIAPVGSRPRHRRGRRLRRWSSERGNRPCSTGPRTSWSTRPSTRPSGCPSSKRWRAPVPSSLPTSARCPRSPVGLPSSPTLMIRAPSLDRSWKPLVPDASRIRAEGIRRAQKFTWGAVGSGNTRRLS